MLIDYYLEPDHIHRLHEALCDLYCGYIERSVRELRPDGFWTSDDLGHQKQLFVRPELFREFMKPYYVRIGAVCREQGVHWWLHSCGNNTDIMGDLAEVAIAHEYGDKLTFLVGIDVQHTLQERDPGPFSNGTACARRLVS